MALDNSGPSGYPRWIAKGAMIALLLIAIIAFFYYCYLADRYDEGAAVQALWVVVACFGLILWGSTRKTD